MTSSRARTLVSFHAHPDDEALLTAGTLARAVDEGHRVVLVTATDGEAGTGTGNTRGTGGGGRTPTREETGRRRRAELVAAAAAIGVHRVVHLGLPDSGAGAAAPADPAGFARLDPHDAAAGLVEVLREERADVLTVYDPAGGYGHPDHRQVFVAGTLAARTAGTPSVLQATLVREQVRRAARLGAVLRRLDRDAAARLADAWTPAARITHRVDVRAWADRKRAALAAHASQAGPDGGTPAVRLLLALPRPLFAAVAGREWFVDPARPPGRCDDVFAAVR